MGVMSEYLDKLKKEYEDNKKKENIDMEIMYESELAIYKLVGERREISYEEVCDLLDPIIDTIEPESSNDEKKILEAYAWMNQFMSKSQALSHLDMALDWLEREEPTQEELRQEKEDQKKLEEWLNSKAVSFLQSSFCFSEEVIC